MVLSVRFGWLDRHAGRAAEILEQGAVEAVEDDEVRFVGMTLALASTSSEHLFEEDAGLHGAKEDQELQIRNIDTSRQHIDGDDDAWIGAIAKLTNALQRAVDLGR